MEGRDVAGAGSVVEDVEQPTVEDRLEGLAERVEAQRVEHLEDGLDTALIGLAPGDLDRALGDVDAEGLGTAASGKDRVLAGPAARVEESTGERAGVGQAENRGLWASDVPRRRRARVRVVPVVGRAGCSHVTILAQ